MTQIFLLKGAYHGENRTWPDPGNWNPVNTVECVGAGGHGYNGMPWDSMQGGSGHGGGGGAYAKGTNIVPTWPAKYAMPYCVPSPNSSADSTIFNSHSWTNDNTVPAGAVKAAIGQPPSMSSGGRYGGAGGSLFGPTGFGGGKGGNGTYTPFSPLAADDDDAPAPRPATNDNGAGGGGSGGPNGAGSTGANGTAAAAGVGGAADGGTVAGGSICQPGKSGTLKGA